MGYFQVRYDSRVVIYEHKMFIRLATVVQCDFLAAAAVINALPVTYHSHHGGLSGMK